uniref:Association with the SNF1 complex (ASC) domain-containing protein n=1 Tax=Kalanchoe fedtschenkoi TaxID=63787 RepID=A0A7N0RA21_KALFE
MGGNVSSSGSVSSRASRSRYDEDAGLMDVMAQDDAYHAPQHQPPSHPPNHMPTTFLPSLLFTSQVPAIPLNVHNERMQTQKLKTVPISIDEESSFRKKQQIPTMIMWTHGGTTVAVEGSWDNWTNKELLEKSGDDFVMVKLLHSGVYHYRFIVNGRWAHDEQLPWAKDGLGRFCNILDVQDYVSEAIESRSALELPPSPELSYDNILDSTFYAKEPPLLPPILHTTILNISQPPAAHKSLPRPPHAVLDHLYIQETRDNPPILAIGSTQRFRGKYVTLEMYRPSRKPYP